MGGHQHTMTDSVSSRIVWSVAAEMGVDPTTLPPLYEAIDPDALEVLFGNGTSIAPQRPGCELRFPYAGREIHVREGHVTVARPSAPSKPKSLD